MTPKEKAVELFDKMYYKIQPDELGKDQESAKQCALIAVEEIEKELYNWIGGDNHSWQLSRIEYFKIVKQEIKKY